MSTNRSHLRDTASGGGRVASEATEIV